MALQQQHEGITQASSSQAQSRESKLAALWRELVDENPVYRKETLISLPIAANLPEGKQEELRNKARAKRADWEALTLPQKLWKKTYPLLIVFAVVYALVPVVVSWLHSGSGGIASGLWGLLLGGMSASSSIVTEREKRTWNALLLSGLTARQILGGKFLFHFQQNLSALIGVFVAAIAIVARGILPPAVLLLIVPILAHHLLSVTVALNVSLWSTSLRQASRKALWCQLGLTVPVIVVVLLSGLALAGVLPTRWLILPLIYTLIVAFSTGTLWKRMERDLWRAPKDFSG